MGGWKTWTGVALTVAGSAAHAFGFAEIGEIVIGSGVGMMAVGIGHKVERSTRAVSEALRVAADLMAKQLPPPTEPGPAPAEAPKS